MQQTIRSYLELEDKNILNNLMRIYCSARRYAFNRWLEGNQSLNELRKEIQEVFGLNSRYAHPAIVDAKAIISSQKELLPLYILNLKNKIKVTTKKLKKNEDKLKKLSGKEAEIQKIKISGIKQRLNKLIKKKQEYEEHLKNKTLPKIVFGGKKNFNLLKKGKISKEEWKELRSNQVYSIGRKVDKGNQNLRLTYLKDNFFELRINIGEKTWIKGKVKVPEIYLKRLLDQINKGESYSVRLLREKGKYYCHISFEVINNNKSNSKGIAGIDLNPEKIAATIIDSKGNFIASRNFNCYAVVYARTNKRDWIIGNTIKEVFNWIEDSGINTITVEKLKFKQNHDTNKNFNFLTHNFAKKKMREVIESRAIREGFEVREVEPDYTSFIGKIKYKDTYGLSDHQAAALVIARRGLGLNEKIPKPLRDLKPLRRQWKDDSWASTLRWKYLSSAVKRKLTHFFKTNDKKTRSRLLGSGGYTPLQYVLLTQYNYDIRHQKTVNAGELGENPSARRKLSYPPSL